MRIVVKPGKRSELLEYLRWDAQVAKTSEPDTWRFDVWEVEREPEVIYLYEAYKDRAAFEDSHKAHDPYKKWNEMVDKTMEQVAEVIPFTESFVTNMDELHVGIKRTYLWLTSARQTVVGVRRALDTSNNAELPIDAAFSLLSSNERTCRSAHKNACAQRPPSGNAGRLWDIEPRGSCGLGRVPEAI